MKIETDVCVHYKPRWVNEGHSKCLHNRIM